MQSFYPGKYEPYLHGTARSVFRDNAHGQFDHGMKFYHLNQL